MLDKNSVIDIARQLDEDKKNETPQMTRCKCDACGETAVRRVKRLETIEYRYGVYEVLKNGSEQFVGYEYADYSPDDLNRDAEEEFGCEDCLQVENVDYFVR